MKTKEHSRQLGDKVVEKFKTVLSYKTLLGAIYVWKTKLNATAFENVPLWKSA